MEVFEWVGEETVVELDWSGMGAGFGIAATGRLVE